MLRYKYYMYIISKRWSSKISQIGLPRKFSVFTAFEKGDGKAFGTWYCLYNQFVCFTLGTATMTTNNLLKLFKVLHEKMQKPTPVSRL